METLTPPGATTTTDVRAVLRASLSNGHPPDLSLLHAAPSRASETNRARAFPPMRMTPV